jgi:excisionase family DNA binding protein
MALEGGEMRSGEKTRVPLAISDDDLKQVLTLYQKFRRSRAKLVGPDGKAQSLPVSHYDFLARLIAELREGQSVAIVQNDAQLTTVESVRMLGVSRQFLIKVLARDEIPHHMVGTNRRVYVRDFLAYKAERDSKRLQILDGLTRAETEDGLDDLESPDDRAGYPVHCRSRHVRAGAPAGALRTALFERRTPIPETPVLPPPGVLHSPVTVTAFSRRLCEA